jgi:hypothetical protein
MCQNKLYQSVETDVVSSILDQGRVYNIMWSSLSVTCDIHKLSEVKTYENLGIFNLSQLKFKSK